MSRHALWWLVTPMLWLAACRTTTAGESGGALVLRGAIADGGGEGQTTLTLDLAVNQAAERAARVCFPLVVELERAVDGRWVPIPVTVVANNPQCVTFVLAEGVNDLGRTTVQIASGAEQVRGATIRVVASLGDHRLTSNSLTLR